ncbi:U-box domain-containing protein 7 [Syzygium oleosum]|uniref:U-box domain-containing protein 7 n=1 Tax=Syzygium oleosum TaxID=219896 RepID=UPI0011D2813B|nr:U-box domain-containing protein 7 [Syzygium oleosum]
MSFSVSLPPQTPRTLPDPPLSSSSSSWFRSNMKLRLFARLRRLLRTKTAGKSPKQSSLFGVSASRRGIHNDGDVDRGGSSAAREDGPVALQRAVKRVHFGSAEERRAAAAEIARLAREDARAKKLMAELGVVQALVAMVGVKGDGARRGAVRALIELADGNHTNKALMVEAGIFLTLPSNKDMVDEQTRHEFAELLLSLSSLKNTHLPPLESSQMIPFTLSTLESSGSRHETKESCLGALYNLSAVLENASKLASNGVAESLLRLPSTSKGLAEKALATLANLVVTSLGKKALEDSPMVPDNLIEVLIWEDQPKCQEISAHILMILAYQSAAQRSKMAKAGIVPVLLEVALLGSTLAQKRALKMLQWFKDERQMKMGPHSGPQMGRVPMGSPVHYREAQEGKKVMRRLVKESLHKNMEMITRRAGAAPSCSSGLKTLVISTSSKSLPY